MENIKTYFSKENFKWVICFLGILIFLLIAEDVAGKERLLLDTSIYGLVSNYITPGITKMFRFITRFGSVEVIFPLWILTTICIQNKRETYFSIFNMVNIVALNQLLKIIFERSRPIGYRLAEASGFSFPSGHSMCSVAFYGFIIFLIFESSLPKYFKVTTIPILSFLIIAIGISRIYLGVHYPSDVIAGFGLAISYLIIFTHILTSKHFIKINRQIKNET